jgi:uncharacterized membrane protein
MSSAPLTERRFEFGPRQQPNQPARSWINVGESERLLSALGGLGLALYGLSRRSLGGVTAAAVGGNLFYRGLTGHCGLYSRLGVNTATRKRGPASSVAAGRGCKIEQTIVVHRPIDEVFAFWRNLENLPRFMRHLQEVRNLGNKRSHWSARAPLGRRVEWDAEIITERRNELIGWRSLPGADVDNAGSVHFQPVPNGRGTEVRVVLKYDPPAGKVGSVIARIFGEEPHRQIAEDLQEFKRLLETGGAESGREQASRPIL